MKYITLQISPLITVIGILITGLFLLLFISEKAHENIKDINLLDKFLIFILSIVALFGLFFSISSYHYLYITKNNNDIKYNEKSYTIKELSPDSNKYVIDNNPYEDTPVRNGIVNSNIKRYNNDEPRFKMNILNKDNKNEELTINSKHKVKIIELKNTKPKVTIYKQKPLEKKYLGKFTIKQDGFNTLKYEIYLPE